jgi:hypothetical protein
MPDFLQLVSMMREQMHATLSRTDVLRPLAWLIGMMATMTALLVFGKAPEWLLICASLCLAGSVSLYFFAYIYCLLKDRDGLRSERYSLEKLAIEHGIYGDSHIGLVRQGKDEPKLISPSAATTTPESER